MKSVQFLPSISSLAQNYDAYILDLWGVIHDGQHLYPGVKEALEALHGQGKKILFLSNAPRRASAVQEVLARMGIEKKVYDAIVTSGETAYQYLASRQEATPRHYVYIGLEKDRRILEGLAYNEGNPEESQFLLLAHSYNDNQPMKELLPLMERCLAMRLPALCINPDLEVVRMNGEHVYCAGFLAQEYVRMGGEVTYYGKPHKAVYELCFDIFDGIARERILAVGDNLATDIKGAQSMGIASALVTGGILKREVGEGSDYEEKCRMILEREDIAPDYVLRAFRW